jgi:hypothetical protein
MVVLTQTLKALVDAADSGMAEAVRFVQGSFRPAEPLKSSFLTSAANAVPLVLTFTLKESG